MNNLAMLVIIVDAIMILVAGLAAAALLLIGKDMKFWWERIFPATAILVGTTMGAGAILAAGRWMFGG
jgi:hypothetical protein